MAERMLKEAAQARKRAVDAPKTAAGMPKTAAGGERADFGAMGRCGGGSSTTVGLLLSMHFGSK